MLVVIPTFNRATLLRLAVESVLSQSYPWIKLVIVDDGSTDETPEVCERFVSGDRRVVYLQKIKGGCASARNFGLRCIDARTGYVSFLDSDDRMLPGKLEREVKTLEEHPDAAFTYSDSVIHVQETGSERVQRAAAAGRPDEFAIEHFLSNEAKSCALLYRPHVFADHRFREDLRFNEDSEFLQRVAIEFKCVYCPAPGCWVLEHAGSKSRNLAEISLVVYASSAEILLDYPGFHRRYRDRIDRRMAQLSRTCFSELALRGRWEQAAAYANGAGRKLMCRWRVSAPVRLRRMIGSCVRSWRLGP